MLLLSLSLIKKNLEYENIGDVPQGATLNIGDVPQGTTLPTQSIRNTLSLKKHVKID